MNRPPPPWFVFAGGGTGGHLFPALAVARELAARLPDARVTFFCTARPVDQRVLDRAGIEAVPLTVRPFTTRPWQWPRFLIEWRRSIARCHRAFRGRRPAFVVGTGGYVSDPPVRAASALGIPTAVLNPDLVPGRANKRLAARVDRVFAQWDGTRAYLPIAPGFRAWGCPSRPAFATAARDDGLARFGLDPARQTLLVTGASQGARTINDALIAMAPDLARSADWQILHLAGDADTDRVRAAYESAGASAVVLPFTDHMPDAMAAADLAVSRAGASTLAELTVAGLASVLLPYPFHRDNHQRKNAEVLEQAGAALIVDDAVDTAANAAALRTHLLPLLADTARRTRMADAARALARPDAAARIAEDLLTLSTT